MYYEKEAISKQLYDWLLKNKYADANLIAKWKKQGYEKVASPFLSLFSIPHSLGALYLYDTPAQQKYPWLTTQIRFNTALLPPLHPDQRNELQRNMHLSCPESTIEGRTGDPVY